MTKAQMTPQELAAYWGVTGARLVSCRALGPIEARRLLDEGFTAWQLKWLIGKYMKDTPFATARAFSAFMEAARDEVPEDAVCGALLSGDRHLRELAEELELLTAAWFPTPEHEAAAMALRAAIERGLEAMAV